MKIKEIKEQVYQLSQTKSTKQLKKERADLVKGRDLRRKQSWTLIFNTLKSINDFYQEITDKEIDKKFGFKFTEAHNFQDLMSNIDALGDFFSSIKSKLDKLEKNI
ncbi:hypothetical protein [Myxosarcina sp. GI1]|uniref:hypothetical protein n=1 Tax=Myxosarcina sp. GI1 TaxID=1541065 RepID=UPI00068B45F4|nr:hypothetical protein [Myxosarcina sp. GI1]